MTRMRRIVALPRRDPAGFARRRARRSPRSPSPAARCSPTRSRRSPRAGRPSIPPAVRTATPAAGPRRKAAWVANGIDSYTWQVQSSCECALNGPVIITVVDGTPTKVVTQQGRSRSRTSPASRSPSTTSSSRRRQAVADGGTVDVDLGRGPGRARRRSRSTRCPGRSTTSSRYRWTASTPRLDRLEPAHRHRHEHERRAPARTPVITATSIGSRPVISANPRASTTQPPDDQHRGHPVRDPPGPPRSLLRRLVTTSANIEQQQRDRRAAAHAWASSGIPAPQARNSVAQPVAGWARRRTRPPARRGRSPTAPAA